MRRHRARGGRSGLQGRAGLVFAAWAAVVLFMGAIDERTLECEQAVAHLQDCCAGLSVPNVCGEGCSMVTLTEAESACIVDRDCDDLRARQVCVRLEALSSGAADTSDGWEAVCP